MYPFPLQSRQVSISHETLPTLTIQLEVAKPGSEFSLRTFAVPPNFTGFHRIAPMYVDMVFTKEYKA
jgi:hypothetical protein